MFDLSGRVALVTGATGHLGTAMSAALAEAGAQVVVSSRRLEKAERFAQSLPGKESGKHLAVAIDQCDDTSIKQGFEHAVKLAGGIDILVNNGHEILADDWRSVTARQFQRQLSNLTGYFLLARTQRNHAVERNRPASIIMLGSVYGLVGSYPDAYEGLGAASPAAYHALKGGVVQLTRHLAVYWAKDRVRVNCLSPGPFPGPQASTELIDRLRIKSPMGRLGFPHELKGAIVFLASDASSYITGHNLVADGGWTAW